MPKIISGLDRQYGSDQRVYRSISSQSLTVPDQSMSVKDIISRSLAGLPTIGRNDFFFDEDEDPEVPYDLTDVDVEKTEAYKNSVAAEKRYLND